MKWNPTPVQPQTAETAALTKNTLRNDGNEMGVEEEKVDTISRKGAPEYSSHICPEAILVPASSSLRAQAFSLPLALDRHPAPESAFDRNCEQSQAPVADRTQDEDLTSGQLHEQCSHRGCHRKESKNVSKTRLAAMGAAEAKRIPAGGNDMDLRKYREETRGGARGVGDGLGNSHSIVGQEMPSGRSSLGFYCKKGSSEGTCPTGAF